MSERGAYWNTHQFQKFLKTIQIDTTDEPCGTTNGWGYVDDTIREEDLFGAVLYEDVKLREKKLNDDDM